MKNILIFIVIFIILSNFVLATTVIQSGVIINDNNYNYTVNNIMTIDNLQVSPTEIYINGYAFCLYNLRSDLTTLRICPNYPSLVETKTGLINNLNYVPLFFIILIFVGVIFVAFYFYNEGGLPDIEMGNFSSLIMIIIISAILLAVGYLIIGLIIS